MNAKPPPLSPRPSPYCLRSDQFRCGGRESNFLQPMIRTGKTAVTKRVLTTVALATLWLAGAGGGVAADAPTPGVELRPAPGIGLCQNPNQNVDCNSPAHWDGDTLCVFTSSHGPSRNSGTSLAALTNRSISTGCGGWLEATWKDTNGTLYGWYHNENANLSVNGKSKVIPRIGAVVSTNNGATWKDLGYILEAPRDSYNTNTVNGFFCGGNGDCSAILDASREYLYIFFSSYNKNVAEQGVSVARMKWADRDQPAGKVWKWHNGAWIEPGLGGLVTPFFPATRNWHSASPDAYWGPSIHWNTYLESYVIVLNRAVDANFRNEGHYATFNRDLSNPAGWTAPRKFSEGGRWYGQILGTEQGKGTDKLAGRVARFFVQGVSSGEIVFTRPGELPTLPGLEYRACEGPKLYRAAPSGLSAPDIGPMDTGKASWSIQFRGSITAPVEGEYAFRAEAESGLRLKINGAMVMDGWTNGTRTGKIQLAKGKLADFQLEYWCVREKDRQPTLRLFWTPPGGRESPVPATAYTYNAPFIVTRGSEVQGVNWKLPDGGLKPVVGVQNIQVFRAGRTKPELADGDGLTYAHLQDLAVWKGRLYAAWGMATQDEDDYSKPYKVVYATSPDGFHWSAPADLFPGAIGNRNNFYFYRAANGRMLAFASGLHNWSALLVREITGDHRLGDVFKLLDCPDYKCTQKPLDPAAKQPPAFETAPDAGFKDACREAVSNNLLLEQQDLGGLLGRERRMQWHDQRDSGLFELTRAFCFYHRKDGRLVGVCDRDTLPLPSHLNSRNLTTLSEDEGKTWFRPMISPTLTIGMGKIWGQRTGDGRFALAGDGWPGPAKDSWRCPLVLVHGDDGREFRDLRVVHGEVPKLRYEGRSKDAGPQCVRGLAEWCDDGTFSDTKQAMWLVYSVNKEDIWVSRIPLPVKPDETEFPTDDFAKATPGGIVPGWNLYSPKWAPATVVEKAGKRSLELRDGDPYDYARAIRAFPEAAKVRAELDLTPAQADGRLEIELCDAASRRPVRVVLTETGTVQAADGKVVTDLGKYAAGEKLSLVITADAAAGRYSVQVNGGVMREVAVADADVKTLQRLSLRTGIWRAHNLFDGTFSKGVAVATDVPLPTPAVFQVQRVKIAAP